MSTCGSADKVYEAFIDMIKCNTTIVIMDAFLQNSTIKLIEKLSNKINSIIVYNNYKTHTDSSILLHKYTRAVADQDILYNTVINSINSNKRTVCCVSSKNLGLTL